MIEIFDTQAEALPMDIYFVASPTNGTMTYDHYYQHLNAHHHHFSNLRSFAITNVGHLKAAIMVSDIGSTNIREMTFEMAIMHQTKEGSDQKLFYSIEPTSATKSEGRYLLVTDKDSIAEAEKFIDAALKALADSPETMEKIMLTNAPITHANRITTSNRFQAYASKLQQLIPTSIDLPVPKENAWKRQTPTSLNLTDDDYPILTQPKKHRKDAATAAETATLADTTDSPSNFSTIDLNEIELCQNTMKADISNELAALRKETEEMRKALKDEFMHAMATLEIQITKSTQAMIQELSQSLAKAVTGMQEQASQTASFLHEFKTQADRFTSQANRIYQHQPEDRMSTTPAGTPMRNQVSRATFHSQRTDIPTTWDDEMDEDTTADGSHNPTSRCAEYPKGLGATTDGPK